MGTSETMRWLRAPVGKKMIDAHACSVGACAGVVQVVWCGVVWCGVVWCGVVWCGVVWCGVVWCGVVWCGAGQGMEGRAVKRKGWGLEIGNQGVVQDNYSAYITDHHHARLIYASLIDE
jgi:hypothetical protein